MRSHSALVVVLAGLAGGCPLPPLPFTGDDDGGTAPADAAVAIDDDGGPGVVSPIEVTLQRRFPTDATPGETFPSCQLASPLRYDSADGPVVIVTTGEEIAALDPVTGARRFSVTLPAPDGEMAFAVSTPVIRGDRLFASYHTTVRTEEQRDVLGARFRHLVAVVDLAAGMLDDDFTPLELAGVVPAIGGGEVPFRPGNALGRARLVFLDDEGTSLIVTFGNARDIQPWHGYAFEIDTVAWAAGQDAFAGFLVTTPEAVCGPDGSSGSRDRRCGGGLWAPSGPLVLPDDDGPAVIFAPGNGQLDLVRGDYANTLMRVRPGLAFDPGCDPALCAAVDVDDPDPACLETCRDLFVPRMPDGEPYPKPADGRCADLTMFECWGVLDYVGGSTPARVVVDGHPLLVYPTKDGSAYLVDAMHLGTLFDREQLVPICGTATSACTMDWAGMSVTEPVVIDDESPPLVLIPTFMPDGEQPAGVVALRVRADDDGGYALERAWEVPSFTSEAAHTRFRRHPSRMTLQRFADGELVAWIVEVRTNTTGRLLGIDVRRGLVVADEELHGKGYRFTLPVLVEDTLYLPSCESDKGPSRLEAWRITRE